MVSETREEELQRVAAIAAAEVVRIMSTVQAQAPNPVAEINRLELSYIRASVEKIEKRLEDHFVTADQFEPIKKLVYGVAGAVGLSLVAAIMALLLRAKP